MRQGFKQALRLAASPRPRCPLPAARRPAAAMATPSAAREARPAAGPQLLSVAPMMEWTDVHYRQLARLLSRHVWLYTEMVVDSTLIHNPDHDRFLAFPPEQHPIVCQLGGSSPQGLAKAAAIVAGYGYDEINLNCGCPSDRVAGAGCFGAALMLRPQLVAECCAAMAAASGGIPVTVKCRIGVDDVDSYEALHAFVAAVAAASPVRHFLVHARKCLLSGLSPLQNRTIPPLRWQWVWALKRDFPHLDFSLNGGVVELGEAGAALAAGGAAGVMVGRAAYHEPWRVLAGADVALFGAASNPAASRRQVLREYAAYADAAVGSRGTAKDGHRMPSVRTLVKPLLGMFHGEPRGKKWRAAVDTSLKSAASVSELLDATLGVLLPETLDAPPPPPPALPREEGELRGMLPHFDAAAVPAAPQAN
jgi:tRNA-dihydrouridine synthase A